jgi:hypothetical protein
MMNCEAYFGMVSEYDQARVFVPGRPLQPSLMFDSGAPLYGRFLALPTNISLGW